MKILIVKPSSLGDVIHALPVLRLLKLHFPDSEIHWWIDSELAPLLQEDPQIQRLHLFYRKRWISPWAWPEVIRAFCLLRQEQFDWVIDLQGLARSALVTWFANGRYSVGVQDLREGAAAFYDHSVPRPSAATHAVDWYLEVLRFLEVPVHSGFCWLPKAGQSWKSIQEKWNPTGEWIALQPGARWWNKCWPVEHYQALVQRITKKWPSVRIAVLGGKGDSELGEKICSAAPHACLDLTGRTNLGEAVEWIRYSKALISNDSGLMHIGVAVGSPVIGIFGPTNPLRTGPYRQLNNVVQSYLPCAPCMTDQCHNPERLACLKGIGPDTVFARLLSLLGS